MTQVYENQLVLIINGDRISLQNVSPSMTLLQYLQQSRRTGTKEGCGDGDCGACTVALVAQNPSGKPCYQAVNSCLIPLGALAGREIVTVEGIANGKLHPVQAAMVQTGGSQCGYCTPGFIMSMFAAYYDGDVDDLAVEGNLCRCTGYLPIRRAAQQVSHANPSDSFSEKLQHASTQLEAIAYASNNQQFYRPSTIGEVFTLMSQYPDATLVAGATDLGLDMSHHRRTFPVLISLEGVQELQSIEQTEDWTNIGAAVTLNRIESTLRGVFPALDEMLHYFAARQVRNRATIGGNIGTASPIGDLPPVLLALDAELTLSASRNSEGTTNSNGTRSASADISSRSIPLSNFFKGYRQTDLHSGEIIVSINIPKSISPNAVKRLSQAYKVGKRGTDDISIVAAAFTVDLDADNQIVHARLAYGGVAATPARAIDVEEMLIGKPWSIETVQQVKPALRDAFTPLTDLRGSADYRKLLVANLFEKFFVEMEAGL